MGVLPASLKDIVGFLDPEVLDNYRLVSNLTFLMKVFKMMVRDQLQNVLYEIAYLNQSEFRPGHGRFQENFKHSLM